MERWAANTLRTLGIILVSGCVLLGSAILGLLSFCAFTGSGFESSGPKHPDQGVLYLVATIAVIVAGIFIIAKLARGISRSSTDAQIAAAIGATSAPQTPSSVPVHFSPTGREAVRHLIFAIGAQVVVSVMTWTYNIHTFWRTPVYPGANKTRLLEFMLVPLALYNLPYLILLIALYKRPERRALAYSVVIPGILILQSLFTGPLISMFYRAHPEAIIVQLLPWLIDVLILYLAYKVIHQTALQPQTSSLIVAAVVAFVYFGIVHAMTPVLYRFARW